MSKRLLVFGGGIIGKKMLPEIRAQFDVLAILDNDKAKHGESIQNVEVTSPSELERYNYDYIVITSTSSSQIRAQLLELGVLEHQILIPKEVTEFTEPVFPWDVVFFLGAMLMIVVAILLLGYF